MMGVATSKDQKWITSAMGIPYEGAKSAASIWKMHVDGSELSNMNSNSTTRNMSPHYTPDGKHIVFVSSRAGGQNIYIISDDGGNVKRLTSDNKAQDVMPAVSPDGSKIIFSSARNNINYRIYGETWDENY